MMTDYKLSPATSEEAETLNDKINAFVAQQVSFHGDTEVLKDYVIKENGLIHISNLADRFVSNPAEIVSLHQHVKVRVLEVDLQRKRVQLKLINN